MYFLSLLTYLNFIILSYCNQICFFILLLYNNMIKDIYKNKYLKHPLTDEEIKELPSVWKFLKYFKKRFIFITDYRDYIIDKINTKYTQEQFYKYESILNKMFWNLRWLMFPLWTNPNITRSQYLDFLKSK